MCVLLFSSDNQITMHGLSTRGHLPRIYCDLPRLPLPTSPITSQMTSSMTSPYLTNPYLPLMPGTGGYVDRILGKHK